MTAALSACEPRRDAPVPAERGEDPVSVLMESVRLAPERTRIEAVGTSRALHSVTLFPAASGQVDAVNFEPGERVSAGDALVELDARDETLAVALARVRLEDAKRQFDRFNRMSDNGAVSQTTLDTARTALEMARIELRRAEVALDDRTIDAPFSGYVGLTDVDAGDRIGPDTAVTTLDDRSTLLVTFEVPEVMIGQLETGEPIDIATWNHSGTSASGRIVDIGSRIDPVTRTFVARAEVDNADDRLRPGMSFRVALTIEGGFWPVVPEVALQWGNDGAYVWTVEEGLAHRVPASVVQRREGRVLIDAPLDHDSEVVVEGTHRMREGLAVRELPAPPGRNDPRGRGVGS